MPIILEDSQSELGQRLINKHAAVISRDLAEHQDIRPARIGILNLMPAASMKRTEEQWLRFMSHTILQIEPVFIKFDDDTRERSGASRSSILERYARFDDIRDQGLDGLIITGDNLERDNEGRLLAFEDIQYLEQLLVIMDWAQKNVYTTIYSCLASHIALSHRYGLARSLSPTKVLGVYRHELDQTIHSPITQDLDDILTAPHSRWGNVLTQDLRATEVDVLAAHPTIGWLLAQAQNTAGGFDFYIQGHPEYERGDIDQEYQRDQHTGQPEPASYYQNGKPSLSWTNDARALHANWMTYLYNRFSSLDLASN